VRLRALLAAALLASVALTRPAAAEPPGPAAAAGGPLRAGPGEKCPVCGMFVARHPDWIAVITFRDGGRAVFDGAKDLFKLWLEPRRWLPSRTREDVAALAVTDYYAVTPVDARAAFYVVGSDVLGPMGRELVPFARREDAEEFLRDHHGTRIVRFDEVTPALVRSLDE
jgi:nitrous oxide reductase accessory protein NosL